MTFKNLTNSIVSVKMYGSMASGLAIDTSDIDLAVTGINFDGDREKIISYMFIL